MAGQKRLTPLSSSSSSFCSSDSSFISSDPSSEAKKAKCQISVSTFEKWQRNFDRDHQTLTWLNCDKDKRDRGLVALLWCSVCREYQSRNSDIVTV